MKFVTLGYNSTWVLLHGAHFFTPDTYIPIDNPTAEQQRRIDILSCGVVTPKEGARCDCCYALITEPQELLSVDGEDDVRFDIPGRGGKIHFHFVSMDRVGEVFDLVRYKNLWDGWLG